MTSSLRPLTDYPVSSLTPVARSCRDVISAAAGVATLLLGREMTPAGGEPIASPFAELEATNPALASALAPMLDAIMELDERTGFLDAVA